MIKAIVFDCDGLIIDTETPHYEAFCSVYRKYGADLPLEIYVQCVGSSFDRFNPYDYLQECVGRPFDTVEVEQAVVKKFDELMVRQSLLPGVRKYLQEAKQLGLRIGLASSSDSNWVNGFLTQHHIVDFFDTIQTKDKVKQVKPDPELYVRAVEALGVSGREAVAFEDSSNGLKAAKAAGLHCVVVPNAITSHLEFEGYDLKLRSMEEISLAEVIQEVNL